MKTRFALCAMIVCIATAVAAGQQVSVNYNHSQSFSPFHTYAWGSNNTNQIQNSILAQVAQQDIDTALQGKGLQKVQESQKPDLILTANGGDPAVALRRAASASRRRSAPSGCARSRADRLRPARPIETTPARWPIRPESG